MDAPAPLECGDGDVDPTAAHEWQEPKLEQHTDEVSGLNEVMK